MKNKTWMKSLQKKGITAGLILAVRLHRASLPSEPRAPFCLHAADRTGRPGRESRRKARQESRLTLEKLERSWQKLWPLRTS